MIKSKLLVEETKETTQIYEGDLLHVKKDSATLPDGSVSTREWIKHPGACAIVPVYENGEIMLIQQFRYPAQQIFLEVPAGKIDPGEKELNTAQRELREETGLEADHYQYIGHFYPCIGYSDEVIHIYTAWGLSHNASSEDHDEFVENETLSFRQAMDLVDQGYINDGKTVVSLSRTWSWWQEHGPFKI
ncbi:NUDIX domain-containing protein [Balneola sp. MJW-20]|uniref:NUDIX domain-containing protein n=1 Tax=Gracilimonas aurantiaca TaxID=3234185 RepID=UPI003466C9D2